MCQHCDWIKGVVDATTDTLTESLRDRLEVVRRTSPNFYQLLVEQSGGDPISLFSKGVMRTFAIELFKCTIDRTAADSEKLVDMTMRVLREAKPSDHTWRTIQAEAIVVQHAGLDIEPVSETKH